MSTARVKAIHDRRGIFESPTRGKRNAYPWNGNVHDNDEMSIVLVEERRDEKCL